jgi:hypothetical protein
MQAADGNDAIGTYGRSFRTHDVDRSDRSEDLLFEMRGFFAGKIELSS